MKASPFLQAVHSCSKPGLTKSVCIRALLTLAAACVWPPPAHAATAPPHDIIAANISVVQLGFENDPASVIVTNSYAIGDFRILPSANRGDYDLQIGDEITDDVSGGIVITSVAQNGRDNFDQFGTEHPLYPGTNFATSHIDYLASGMYFIPVTMTWPNSFSTSVIEYNINVSAAWFRYDKWLAGRAHYSDPATMNNTTLDTFTGSAGLVLGTHFIDLNDGRYEVNLTSLGIDSRTDGVLLVLGAKNEDNYGLSQVNTNNGTWLLYSKDNGTDGASLEQDPMAFVFVPRTNTLVVSGRFLGDGTIDKFSGATPQFTVTNFETGKYELKIPGHSPAYGVLIISPEGGFAQNRDNIVTYQVNPAGDGWIIESRDLAATLPLLESPGVEPVASFVYIPGPTPGVTVTPTNGLFTTENGGTVQFAVVLDTPPAADVTIGVSSSNAAEGTAAPATLTFTTADWNIPQLVTITGQDDLATDGAVAYSIMLSAATSADLLYNGTNPSDVSVVNLDNDGGFTVNPTAGLSTTEAGGTAQFTIVLNRQPTAEVTVGLSSSDTTEGTVSPASVTFNDSDWNVPKTVTATGVNDFVDDGNVGYSIVTGVATSADPTFSGLNPSDVSVSNTDDDTAGVNVSASGSFGLAVAEGGTTNFTVALTSEPAANVTVNVSSSNTSQGGTVAPGTLTFTPANWSDAQPVTITGADDLMQDASTAWLVTNVISSADSLYAALSPITVVMTTLDNEPVLALPSGDAIYGTGMPGIGIDGRATLVDPGAPNYNAGTLTVTLTANGTADDRLEIRNTGTGAGQIGVSGNTVSYGGTAIGTFAGGVGTTPLVVTFNSAATPAAGQALLRNVTFRTLSQSTPQNRRSISVTLAHPDGGTGTATTGIRVGLMRLSEFQEGADHGYGVYTGAADTEIFESQPDTPFPSGHSATGIWMDGRRVGMAEEAQILMRFENIIGNGPGQIPTNALIVHAELLFDVNDTGAGSPLVRMLIPWNAETETWNSLVGGIHPDDVEARSSWESQLGVAQISGASTVGTIRFGVTPDIQAWTDGATNYGWGLTSWDTDLNPSWGRGENGLAISPSEATNIDERPRLRVLWVPTNTPMAGFRQDVNGYTGVRDTRLRARAADADTSFATSPTVFVDWEVTGGSQNEEHILIRFEDIIGNGAGQVPPGATVHAAMLDLASVFGDAMGDGGRIHAMLQPWQDSDTWNSLINGISMDDVEAAIAPTATAGSSTLNPDVQGAFLSFELTPDVQAWVGGARANYGWAVLPWPGGANGWGFNTSEIGTEQFRPRLRVFFTGGVVNNIVLLPPVWSPTSVQLSFTGTIGNTYSVLRAPAVTGPWTTNGTATVGGSGTATYTDSAPPDGAAFYRVFYP